MADDFESKRLADVTVGEAKRALIYGAVLLGETVTTSALAGLVLILTGTALGSGLLRLRRRAPVPASP